MKARLQAWAARLDGLKANERALLLAAGGLLMFMAFSELAMQPLIRERQMLTSQLAQNGVRLTEQAEESARIVEASRINPDDALAAQIAAAETQIEAFKDEIREQAGQLIEPEQMADILQRVLQQIRGLEFVSLEGLGAEPLLPPAKDGQPASDQNIAYRHGLRIRFKGSYLDTVAYLRALEALPWRLFWDAVEINVIQHPTVESSIVVYTLSLDRRWIGV